MANVRDGARIIIDEAVPDGVVIRSNDPPIINNRFEQLTNTPHATMLANWLGGGIMTACNGFVGWYADKLGINGITNWFNLRDSLSAIKRQDAWVKSTPYTRPKYGDILKHTITHVDVSLDFSELILNRVAAGQGDGTIYSIHPRPRSRAEVALEYDVLRRVEGTKAYSPYRLEGWLDIEVFLGDSYFIPVPEWLVGWWETYWRGEVYYYYFDTDNTVKWTQVSPFTAFSPINVSGTGRFTNAPLLVTITWDATGSVETWVTQPAGGFQTMAGTYNNTELVWATKI